MKDINEKEFRELQTSGKKILVDFWASWCRPCLMLAPILDKLQEEYPDIEFVKVNVSQEMNLAQEFGITSIPTVILFNGKDINNRVTGVNGPDYYRNLLNSLK